MIIYLITISFLTFVIYGIDKYRATTGKWRVSESTLLSLAAVGGSVGAILGMLTFRHKIRKPLFIIGIPFLTIIQCLYVILIQ